MAKICVVSPWPPHVGGVALHSYEMVREWVMHSTGHEFTVLTTCSHPKPLLGISISTLNSKSDLPDFSRFDRIIHVITNHPYSNLGLYLIPKVGGLVILHETNINETIMHGIMFKKSSPWRFDEDRLNPRLVRLFKAVLNIFKEGDLLNTLQGLKNQKRIGSFKKIIRGINFTNSIARNADHVICFSDRNRDKLHRQSGVPESRFSVVPLTFPPIKSERIENDSFTFGLFGHQHSSKHYHEVLLAFHQFTNRHRNASLAIALHIVGSFSEDLIAIIEEIGLSHVIKLIPTPDDELWFHELAQIDCLVALRFPTLGEASGPVVQSALNGTISIVMDVDWFGGLPSWVALKIDPSEIENLVGALVSSMELAFCGGDITKIEERRNDIALKAGELFSMKKTANKILDIILEEKKGGIP